MAPVEAWRDSRWAALVVAVALCGLLLRLLLIAHTGGGSDLRIYTYFSRLPLHGVNPFRSPANGEFAPVFGNSPPVEVAAFAGLLSIHDSVSTLRVVFALSDAALLLIVGLWFPRRRGWRAAFICFYAFNPFVLFAWTTLAEDKTLLLLGITVLLLALERSREWTAWLAAAALAAFKFLGTFLIPALAIDTYRRRGRWVIVPLLVFVAVLVLSNLPWFPASLHAFSRRDSRLGINPPIHASPTLLLARIGVYAPFEAKLLTAAGILVVLALQLARRIDVREAVVWSLFAGYVFLPDDALDRLLLITIPFLLIVELSPVEWAVVWGVSILAAVAGDIAVHGVPHALASLGGPLRSVFAHESTVRHVLWMCLLPATVVALYFRERTASARPNASAIAS